MTQDRNGLFAHLKTGTTTVCQAWAVTRRDGVVMGFTDHDRDLSFDGITFKADTGLSARALQQTTGLAVDNTEAQGALSSAAITEADVMAGRYDRARVQVWSVNWQDCDQRVLQFAGTLGEVTRSGALFQAEMRGLSETLNQPRGRVYQRSCPADLGDAQCRFDLSSPGYALETAILGIEDGFRFRFAEAEGFAAGWFRQGRLTVLDGAAAGFSELIRGDDSSAAGREIALWQQLGLQPGIGDRVRLDPGCDKRTETCKAKFNNFINFRGHPHIPGESWLASYPTRGGGNSGGRRG